MTNEKKSSSDDAIESGLESLGDDLLSDEEREDLLSDFDEILSKTTGESSVDEEKATEQGNVSDLEDLETFLEEFDSSMEEKVPASASDEAPPIEEKRELELAEAELDLSSDAEGDQAVSVADGAGGETEQERVETLEAVAEDVAAELSDDDFEIFTAADELEEEFNESVAEVEQFLTEEHEPSGESMETADSAEEQTQTPEVVIDAAPVEMEAVELELPLESPADEPDVALEPEVAKPVPAAAAAPTTVQAALDRKFTLGLLLLAIIALAVGGGGFWMALGLSSEVETLNTSLASLKQAQQNDGQENQELAMLRSDLQRAELRLNEMAVIIEGPMSHLEERSKEDINGINERLARIEGEVTKLRKVGVSAAKPVAKAAPAASTGGWLVNLVSLTSSLEADKQVKQLKSLGVDAIKRSATIDGKTWYRLQVVGFGSKQEARAYADKVATKTGMKNAWVGKE
jgi:hypothetical protein